MADPQVRTGQRTFLLRQVAAACRCTLHIRPHGPVWLYHQLGALRATQ